jgi:hypothetical protein
MESDPRTQASTEVPAADDADVQEQQRLIRDDGADPEQMTSDVPPDTTRMDADPADVQEQSIEVPDEEE